MLRGYDDKKDCYGYQYDLRIAKIRCNYDVHLYSLRIQYKQCKVGPLFSLKLLFVAK
jgi:hypothetical protein